MCVQYIGGCSVHWGVLSTLGDSMSTSGDIMISCGGYHDYIGGCSVHRGFQYWNEMLLSDLLSHMNHDIPRCTHDIPPMNSWYPPDVLMISPDVLTVSPWCTEHPPMYWISSDVFNIPLCTEHTLYRVIQGSHGNCLMMIFSQKMIFP